MGEKNRFKDGYLKDTIQTPHASPKYLPIIGIFNSGMPKDWNLNFSKSICVFNWGGYHSDRGQLRPKCRSSFSYRNHIFRSLTSTAGEILEKQCDSSFGTTCADAIFSPMNIPKNRG
jgi:hypothetical protein